MLEKKIAILLLIGTMVTSIFSITLYATRAQAQLTFATKSYSTGNNRYFAPDCYPIGVKVSIRDFRGSTTIIEAPTTIRLSPGTYYLTVNNTFTDDFGVNFSFYRWTVRTSSSIRYYYTNTILLNVGSGEVLRLTIEFNTDTCLWRLILYFNLRDGTPISPPERSVQLIREKVDYGTNYASSTSIYQWIICPLKNSSISIRAYYLWESNYAVIPPKYIVLDDGYVASFRMWSDGSYNRIKQLPLNSDTRFYVIYDKVPQITITPTTLYTEVPKNSSKNLAFTIHNTVYDGDLSLSYILARDDVQIDPKDFGLNVSIINSNVSLSPDESSAVEVSFNALVNASTGVYKLKVVPLNNITYDSVPLTINVTPTHVIIVENITMLTMRNKPSQLFLPLEKAVLGLWLKVNMLVSGSSYPDVEIGVSDIVPKKSVKCIYPMDTVLEPNSDGEVIFNATIVFSNYTGLVELKLTASTIEVSRNISIVVELDVPKIYSITHYYEDHVIIELQALFNNTGTPITGRGGMLSFWIPYMLETYLVDDEGMSAIVLYKKDLKSLPSSLEIYLNYNPAGLIGVQCRLDIVVVHAVTLIHSYSRAGELVIIKGRLLEFETFNPIPNATIKVLEINGSTWIEATSNSTGFFEISIPIELVEHTTILKVIPQDTPNKVVLLGDLAEIFLSLNLLEEV